MRPIMTGHAHGPPAHSVDLALQGGGAHGAYTWGVLDRLLEDERVRITGISGTSAGAMCAVALASGLATRGRAGARDALGRLWARIGEQTRWPAIGGAVLGSLIGRSPLAPLPGQELLAPVQPYVDLAARWWAPYTGEMMGLDPLREALLDTVDFERVRASREPRLFVSATAVRTGKLRVFAQSQITIDAVLASACLPQVFRPIEIDGEPYWDGGYMGNPALLPLLTDSPSNDLLLVQINPARRARAPANAAEIVDRVNEIVFNASLAKELRSIALLRRALRAEGRAASSWRDPLLRQVAALRMHRIDASETVAAMGGAGALDASWHAMQALHRRGREAAHDWLDANLAHLGRRATVDLEADYLD